MRDRKIYPRWANAIWNRRKVLGLSLRKFGDGIGVTESTVYYWEIGKHKPNPFFRDLLHEVYNIPYSAYEAYE